MSAELFRVEIHAEPFQRRTFCKVKFERGTFCGDLCLGKSLFYFVKSGLDFNIINV